MATATRPARSSVVSSILARDKQGRLLKPFVFVIAGERKVMLPVDFGSSPDAALNDICGVHKGCYDPSSLTGKHESYVKLLEGSRGHNVVRCMHHSRCGFEEWIPDSIRTYKQLRRYLQRR